MIAKDDEARDALARATMEAERLRHGILAVLFAVVSVGMIATAFVHPDPVIRVTHGGGIPWFGIALVVVVAVDQLVMWRAVDHWIAVRRAPSPLFRYSNAFVETSIPTIIMLIETSFTTPLAAVLSPPHLIYFVFIALSGLRLDARLSVFTGVWAALQYVSFALYAVSTAGDGGVGYEPILLSIPAIFGRGIVMIIASVVTGVVGNRVRAAVASSVQHLLDKKRVVDLFGEQVSAAVVEKLLSQPELLSETRHVCVMFLDIRDFTTFSEKKKPEEVVAYLNSLWSFMVDVVNAHGGIINKFLGDGFMATFGAPVSSGDGEDCKNAVRAAKEILALVDSEHARGAIVKTRVGIGLHAGRATTGNIGGRRRKEYSVIGDVVNLASRIESLNKQHSACLLVSENVRDGARDDCAGAAALGPITVKGRAEPVHVFKLA